MGILNHDMKFKRYRYDCIVIFGKYLTFLPLLAKKKTNVDIRTVGSGNAGTTNVAAIWEKSSCGFDWRFVERRGGILYRVSLGRNGNRLLRVLAVVIGHVFPVFLKFHGGKGVATSIGAMMMLEPTSGIGWSFGLNLVDFIVFDMRVWEQ